MLFIFIILVSVQREHDSLEKVVNLRNFNQTGESGDIPNIRLQQIEQLAITLHIFTESVKINTQIGQR